MSFVEKKSGYSQFMSLTKMLVEAQAELVEAEAKVAAAKSLLCDQAIKITTRKRKWEPTKV